MDTGQGPKPGGRPPGRAIATETAVKIRQNKAIDLRVKGYTVREIAAELGISKSQAFTDVQAVLGELAAETMEAAEQERNVAMEQISQGIRAVLPFVLEGDPKAIQAFAKLDERRAKYMGNESAAKHEVSGPQGAPITVDARDSLIERIAGMVGRSIASAGAGATDPKPES